MSNTALATMATMDAAYLAELSGMVTKEEIATAADGPAVLKINYDEESAHGTGGWLVGQKKDKDGNITDQGQSVNSIIILAVKLQNSYYDEKNVKNCFSTKMYDWGGKPSDKDEFEAKLVAIGKAGEGRFRCVCFSLAILPDGTTVDCVSYFGGTSYKPFKAHYDAITRQKLNGKFYDFPPFVCVTNLPTPEKGKSGSRTYYIANLAIGQMLERDMILACGSKREEVYDYVDQINSSSDRKQVQAPAIPAAPQAPPQAPKAPAVQHNTGDDAFPVQEFVAPTLNIGGLKQASVTIVPPTPKVAEPLPSMNPMELDLEAAINAAL